jgi:molybdopterin-binding protein
MLFSLYIFTNRSNLLSNYLTWDNPKGGIMKISARNILKGRAIVVSQGAVNTEIPLELAGGRQLVSIIFKESAKKHGLKSGKKAYAIIKASNVMIAVG